MTVPLTQATKRQTKSPPRIALLGYCLFALGILFGITAIIGMLIGHTRLHTVAGTPQYRHVLWQLSAFWLVSVLCVVAVWLWPSDSWRVIAGAALAIWATTCLAGCCVLLRQRADSTV